MQTDARRWLWPCFLLLLLAGLAWRLPYAATRAIVTEDEVLYSQPTVERMVAGERLFYIGGTNYNAPSQEALSLPLVRQWGLTPATLRAGVVLAGALAAAVSFLAFLHVMPRWPAFACAALLACGNSAVCHYSTFSHPGYAMLALLVQLAVLATFRVERTRAPLAYLLLGLVLGLAVYQLKLGLMQAAGSLLWLALRSDLAQRSWARFAEPRVRRRGQIGLATGVLAALLLLPLAYHYLTRRDSYAPGHLEQAGWAVAGLFAGVSGLLLLSVVARPRWGEVWPVTLCVLLVLGCSKPADWWYQHVEQPRMAAAGVSAYAEASYSWKHLHDWPTQAKIYLGGVIPALASGSWGKMEGNFEAQRVLGVKGAVTVAGVLLLVVVGFRRVRHRAVAEWLLGKEFVLIAPFLITSVVLFPSWVLFSDYSYRYLLPYFPGLLVLIVSVFGPWLQRYGRLALAAVALVLIYNGFDCAWYLR